MPSEQKLSPVRGRNGERIYEPRIELPVRTQKRSRRYIRGGILDDQVLRLLATTKRRSSILVYLAVAMEYSLRKPDWVALRGRLKALLNLDRQTVYRAFRELEQIGLVKVKHEGNKLTQINLVFPEEEQ